VRNTHTTARLPVLLFVVIALTLGGCAAHARVSVHRFGDNIDPRSVEHTIDLTIATQLRRYDPTLRFEQSRCPDHIDVSLGKTAACTLPVNDVALPVNVTYGGPPQQYNVNLPGSFYLKSHVEEFIAGKLRARDVNATVVCPGASVSVLAPGASVVCSIVAPGLRETVSITAGRDGSLGYGLPTQMHTTPLDQALVAVSRAHVAGKPSVISGSFVEAFLDQAIPGAKARCPSQVDLTGSRRATCITAVSGQDVRQSVWIDGAGNVHWLPLDAVLAMPHVKVQAERLLNEMLREDGSPSIAQVDCGSGSRVIAVPANFNCALTIDGKPLMQGGDRTVVRVEVPDGSGKFNIDLVAGGVVLH